MAFTTLIAPAELAPHLDNPDWVVIDCRFSLTDPEQGRRMYQQNHIPGAQYAHLDEDLAGPIVPGVSGRHPLPAIDTCAAKLAAWGIDSRVQVVAYDDFLGGFAGRLWWLLRWLGHTAAAVLDGGLPRWEREGFATRGGSEQRTPRQFVPHPRPDMVVTTDDVLRLHSNPAYRLLDARTVDRYRGENEPHDPVAGHIPGARSVPFFDNVDSEGRFLPAEHLREKYSALLAGATPANTVAYCGSGVTAAHTLLAMEHAGLGMGRLYAGSWSEWGLDPQRPVAQGDEDEYNIDSA